MPAIAPPRRPLADAALNGAAAHRHLTPEEMAQVLSRYQDPAEVEHQLVRHLVACCGDCRAVSEQVRGVAAEFGHWNHAIALAETAQAPELWRELEGRGFREQLAAVAGDERYQTWGLCRLLQRLSQGATAAGPARAGKGAELASLALAVSCQLEPIYDEEWIRDLQARSYALLGDARRVLGELHGAGDAFELARRCRLAGTGDPAVEAEVQELEALLRGGRVGLGKGEVSEVSGEDR